MHTASIRVRIHVVFVIIFFQVSWHEIYFDEFANDKLYIIIIYLETLMNLMY